MSTINFGVIGAGWRCRFFIRIAKAFPEQFNCVGVVARDAEKRQAFGKQWAVNTYASLRELLDTQAVDFIVVSTKENDKVMLEVIAEGLPCLTETPPARTEDGLIEIYEKVKAAGGKVQVAEQYHLHPHHQAQMAVLKSGKIGEVAQIQASVAHAYHGMSIIRHFLGIGFENAAIRGTEFTSPIIKGPDRAGPPKSLDMTEALQVLAWFHFENGKFGVLDFTNKQYRAWIRRERLLLRGERGEITNNQVRYMKSFDEPMAFELERVTHGQEEDTKPPGFIGYRGEGEWLYRTPFSAPILMDDEIAIAHCLLKMADFVRSGQSFYSLEEACQDTYLGILYERAAKEDSVVESKTQVWAQS